MDPQLRPFLLNLERLHEGIFEAVEPLTDRELNWEHPQLSNTIGILLRHVAGSERYWIIEIVGGRKIVRNRDAEFGHERLAKDAVVADLRRAYDEVRAVLESLRAEDLTRDVEIHSRGERHMLPGAFALVHSLQHTSYHLGQIQLFKRLATTPVREDR
jgi:uncharacterized damage-inducible protein DinB